MPPHNDILENLRSIKPKTREKEILIEHLEFLKHLLTMIADGATGYKLAYELEKNQEVKSFFYDGVLFYNTFLEVGNKRFIDAPDRIKRDYKSFKTIEDTEKYIFMIWLKNTIATIEEKVRPKGDYAKFLKTQKVKVKKEVREKQRQKVNYCKNCGEKVRSEDQKYCEVCGESLIELV